jgi:hypothetical protein
MLRSLFAFRPFEPIVQHANAVQEEQGAEQGSHHHGRLGLPGRQAHEQAHKHHEAYSEGRADDLPD